MATFKLNSADVFYGDKVYPMTPEAFGDFQTIEDGTPLKRFELAATLRRAGVFLPVAEIAERMQVKRIPAAHNPETGKRFHPELVVCHGNGFSVAWARQD